MFVLFIENEIRLIINLWFRGIKILIVWFFFYVLLLYYWNMLRVVDWLIYDLEN